MKNSKILILSVLFCSFFALFISADADEKTATEGNTSESNILKSASSDNEFNTTKEFFFHKLKAGENIALLATRYYGDANKWKLILDTNDGLDPKKMQIGDEIKIVRIENHELLKPVSITKADKINFELLTKSSKYNRELCAKVCVYIAKLNHNVYAKIDEIKQILLEESNWSLESVKIPEKQKKNGDEANKESKQINDEPAQSTVNINAKSYYIDVIDGKDSNLNRLWSEINEIKYTDVGVDITSREPGNSEKETNNNLSKKKVDENNEKVKDAKSEDDEKMCETGKRLSTSTSVTLNRKIEELQNLITQYHDILYAYLKSKYSEVLKGLLIREQALPNCSKKINNDELKSYVSEVFETKYSDEFDKNWNVGLNSIKLDSMNFVDSYKNLRDLSSVYGHKYLIYSSDLKFVESLENMLTINESLKKKALIATFRSGWDEFGSGWIMFIFGVLTLYGGLMLTFVLDFRARGKTEK